ncbi:MotA/TolQ/ExbB proton channel family protein [Virgibacillus sp. W0430]|uniref:MotA/TolQ/ExbB proton channel family protein n=1 Tax=Virgibacillus sp. W0430 TaxID=3391580 RepID=UPI003F483D8E
MVEAVLGIFINREKVELILANPIIEFIFIILLFTFIATFLIHIALFNKLKNIRNYVRETNQMDMEPLNRFEKQFNDRQQTEAVKPETFVQEQFSSWRLFNIPVVSLIKTIQMTVSMFILIGVLGTFIGLTISLSSINTEGDQLVENVSAVLAGIDVAFYTSIAGMGLSLIMTVCLKIFNTEYLLTDIMLKAESILEGHEEGSMHRLIDVSETINESILRLQKTNEQSLQAIVNAFSGFQDYTSSLQQSAKDLAAFNDGLTDNLQQFQNLFHNMKQITDGFSDATTKLNTNFDTLFAYFKKADGRNERLSQTVEGMYERIKEASKAQKSIFEHFQASVDELKQYIHSIVEEQTDLQASFKSIIKQNSRLVDTMGQHNKEFKNVFGNNVSAQLAGIVSTLSKLSNDFDMLENAIGSLPEALETISHTQVEYKHLLIDRFEELKQFNRTFNNHLKSHADDSIRFDKQVQEASRTYEQIGLKNNELLHEINTVISKTAHISNEQERQIELKIAHLTDALTKHVAILGSTLEDKLDRVVRNMHETAEKTSDGLNRDFRELSRITGDIQKENFRFIQQILQELSREIQQLNRQLSVTGQHVAQRNQTARLSQNEF